MHDCVDGEDYYFGVFLVGAYQETLGDLHNLIGDTNVVSVRIDDDGTFDVIREISGDSRRRRAVLRRVRAPAAGRAVPPHGGAGGARRPHHPAQRQSVMEAFEAGLRGYTYFEH